MCIYRALVEKFYLKDVIVWLEPVDVARMWLE